MKGPLYIQRYEMFLDSVENSFVELVEVMQLDMHL
jgi:hypothetical protein